ncbi:MFS transporter [Bathymodiolus japonicus methanotrophic gill symbiont]|uniref:MFS transporter n=1 Tax=Bathymodiolus japonicus methanotrophic gill symbiont TaxID=113269 RepID=UPI001C8D9785|nr:MFS transporter [Bathymodiolus japonicus methanotrophic gill symbiont]
MQQVTPMAERRELISWALYDFANSGYTTVVMSTIYSTYFVGVIAVSSVDMVAGMPTLLWSIAIGLANFVVMIIGPVVGALADHQARKKIFLLISSIGCVLATALLAFVEPGEVLLSMLLVTISAIMFAQGENLIAAFLPELVPKEKMGRMSGYGWSVGYFGGLLTLGLCLWLITWGQQQGMADTDIIPLTLLLTAGIFAVSVMPTFLWLRERAVAQPEEDISYFRLSFNRLQHTFKKEIHFKDFFRFLLCLAVYQSGVSTVIVLAAIYAQEVMDFDREELIILIMVVNVTAAVGALICGHLQDKIGSVPTLAITLVLWIIAILTAFFATESVHMWIAGNLIGAAMGSSQSVSRALVSKFTPAERSGEFLGLWGVVIRLSAIVGPLSYGVVNFLSRGDHRLALLSTLMFFILGLLLLVWVDERRGKIAAKVHS